MQENIIIDTQGDDSMAEDMDRKRQQFLQMFPQAGPVEKPPVEHAPVRDLSQMRPVIKATVNEQAKNAGVAFSSVMDLFLKTTPGLKTKMKDSQLLMLHQVNSGLRKEDIFKDCQVQYGYNQRQKIYSIQATLYGRPRIITIQVGETFSQVSLADKNGSKVLEVLRQEDGKGVTFNRMD